MSGIFFKLLFKAMMPILVLVGIMSYLMYVQGQDPFAPLKSAAGGFSDQVGRVGENVKSMASGLSAPILNGDGNKQRSAQRIYRWTDKQGVTHFGTSRPDYNTNVQALDINPNANVVDSFKAPTSTKQRIAQKTDLSKEPGGFMPMTANPAKIKQMLQQASELNAARLQQLQEIQ